MVTLTAACHIAIDPTGQVQGDHVAVCHLRGSLPAMARLRNIIDDMLTAACAPAPEPGSEPEAAPQGMMH